MASFQLFDPNGLALSPSLIPTTPAAFALGCVLQYSVLLSPSPLFPMLISIETTVFLSKTTSHTHPFAFLLEIKTFEGGTSFSPPPLTKTQNLDTTFCKGDVKIKNMHLTIKCDFQ